MYTHAQMQMHAYTIRRTSSRLDRKDTRESMHSIRESDEEANRRTARREYLVVLDLPACGRDGSLPLLVLRDCIEGFFYIVLTDLQAQTQAHTQTLQTRRSVSSVPVQILPGRDRGKGPVWRHVYLRAFSGQSDRSATAVHMKPEIKQTRERKL